MDGFLINKLFEIANKSRCLKEQAENVNLNGQFQDSLDFLSVVPGLCVLLIKTGMDGNQDAEYRYRETMFWYGTLIKKEAFSTKSEISRLESRLSSIESKFE